MLSIYQLEICIRDTPGDILDWVTWVVCNLQTRNRFYDVIKNKKNGFINQLLFSRRHISESFKGFMFPTVVTKYLFENTKYWSVKSNYFSKWVIWTCVKATEGCVFGLKMFLKNFFSSQQLKWCCSYHKKFVQEPLCAWRVKKY